MTCSRCGGTDRVVHDGPLGIICCKCFEAIEKRNEQVLAHIPLVHYVVNRMARDGGHVRNLEREDALAEGIAGLIQAVDAFDERKGSSWASYAIQRVRGSILDASRKADPLGRRRRADVHRLDQRAAELAMEIGHWPSRQQLADALGLTTEAVAQIERDADAGPVPLGTMDWAAAPARDPVEAREDVQELRRAIARLPDRDGAILDLHWREGLPFHQIGKIMGLSESRICGLHRRALQRLADAMAEAA